MSDWRIVGLALAFVYAMARLDQVNRRAMRFAGLFVLALAGYKTVPMIAAGLRPSVPGQEVGAQGASMTLRGGRPSIVFGDFGGAMPAVVAVGGGGGDFDPFLPAGWTDTVHYETYSDTSNTDTNTWPGDPPQEVFGDWTNVVNENGQCHGGALTAFTPACQLVDTFTVAGMSDPYWHESLANTGDAGIVRYRLNMADANGPAAAASLTRVHIRLSMSGPRKASPPRPPPIAPGSFRHPARSG